MIVQDTESGMKFDHFEKMAVYSINLYKTVIYSWA